MKIKQLHFPEIDSTQTYLVQNFSKLANEGETLLVSTEKQNAGHGRRGSEWLHFGHSLAFSFTLAPHPTLTLTALELAVLIRRAALNYLAADLKLKWPNDLFFQGKKVGGIIVQNLGDEQMAVGLGLNLGQGENAMNYQDIPLTNLGQSIQENLPHQIVSFILKNRIEDFSTLKKEFEDHCLHLNFHCETQQGPGKFQGIGSLGQALIEDTKGNLFEVFSGSLYLR